MKTITKQCLNCNRDFEAPLREHRRGNGKFCCLSCSSSFRSLHRDKPDPNAFCALCNKHFYKKPSSFKNSKSGLYFCSRACKDKAQRIGGIKDIQPPHYGNHSCSYREFAFRNLEYKCCRCNYDEHIAALVVHHKDRNRSNNKLDNLEILCANCHAIEHWS